MTAQVQHIAVLRQAISIGLATGFIDALYSTARFIVLQRPVWNYSYDSLWMTPVATSVTLLLLSLPVIVMTVFMQKWLRPPLVTFLIGFPAVYALIRGTLGDQI